MNFDQYRSLSDAYQCVQLKEKLGLTEEQVQYISTLSEEELLENSLFKNIVKGGKGKLDDLINLIRKGGKKADDVSLPNASGKPKLDPNAPKTGSTPKVDPNAPKTGSTPKSGSTPKVDPNAPKSGSTPKADPNAPKSGSTPKADVDAKPGSKPEVSTNKSNMGRRLRRAGLGAGLIGVGGAALQNMTGDDGDSGGDSSDTSTGSDTTSTTSSPSTTGTGSDTTSTSSSPSTTGTGSNTGSDTGSSKKPSKGSDRLALALKGTQDNITNKRIASGDKTVGPIKTNPGKYQSKIGTDFSDVRTESANEFGNKVGSGIMGTLKAAGRGLVGKKTKSKKANAVEKVANFGGRGLNKLGHGILSFLKGAGQGALNKFNEEEMIMMYLYDHGLVENLEDAYEVAIHLSEQYTEHFMTLIEEEIDS